jgi:hypothetical protein
MDSSCSECGPVASCCEHGNETSGSIEGEEFIDQLSALLASEGPFRWSYLFIYLMIALSR